MKRMEEAGCFWQGLQMPQSGYSQLLAHFFHRFALIYKAQNLFCA
jgi:hypothetical protein